MRDCAGYASLILSQTLISLFDHSPKHFKMRTTTPVQAVKDHKRGATVLLSFISDRHAYA